jgi:hypothetical protein
VRRAALSKVTFIIHLQTLRPARTPFETLASVSSANGLGQCLLKL